MKKCNRRIVILIFSISISAAFSQEKEKNLDKSFVYNSVDPHYWDEPDYWLANLDAVIAAPKNHKILMENDQVRVLEITLLPGETEEIHHHRWPSVLYIQEAGDFIDYDEKGKIILDTRQLKTPLTFPMTMWKDPEAPHSVENLSTSITIRLIRVEMKN
ncbi:MAG: cupin domain-containing protein [Lutibacter sp.]